MNSFIFWANVNWTYCITAWWTLLWTRSFWCLWTARSLSSTSFNRLPDFYRALQAKPRLNHTINKLKYVAGKTPNLATPATSVVAYSRVRHQNKMQRGSHSSMEATVDATKQQYDHLKQFYDQVVGEDDGNNLTFLCKLCPPAFSKKICTSVTLNSYLSLVPQFVLVKCSWGFYYSCNLFVKSAWYNFPGFQYSFLVCTEMEF